MVEQHANLDRVFGALADPTRRRILKILLPRELRVGEIADSFAMSLAAISKHLQVLERANLVSRRRQGRAHQLSANPDALTSAHEWITRYAQGWTDGLDALEQYLESHHPEERVSETRDPDLQQEDNRK